jgi:hypothetical protein
VLRGEVVLPAMIAPGDALASHFMKARYIAFWFECPIHAAAPYVALLTSRAPLRSDTRRAAAACLSRKRNMAMEAPSLLHQTHATHATAMAAYLARKTGWYHLLQ